MGNDCITFIQQNSPDGGFLQSSEWKKFQESVGRKTFSVSGDNFQANIIEHTLPMVGKYFYIPRGPVIPAKAGIQSEDYNFKTGSRVKPGMTKLLELAKENNAGWIRVEPNSEKELELIKNNTKYKITKAPHDMQPREIFIIDITKPEEQLLKEMKSKARYNIKIAQKRGVSVKVISDKKYIEEFLRLTQIMAKRQGIETHPGSYYKKMLEIIPGEILKLYVAEYQDKIIAANIVIVYARICTYLHGASDDEYRNVMAPFLLQWQQIQDARMAGCEKYDFGGINISNEKSNWAGITRFKLGFSPDTQPTVFPGCYDIIINRKRYGLYRAVQKIKSFIK
jgi:lipid II:glycine glycyltransferase (peptidoglycan interpeptide bridge formation enzyme)